MDGIPSLLPQHHDDGELHGKFNKLHVEHWIGENCLMSDMVRETKSSLAMKALSGTESKLPSPQCATRWSQTHENKLSSSALLHNDSSFAGFTLNGEIKQGSITQCLSKDLEDPAKEHLDPIYIQNQDENFHHNMEHLSWHNVYVLYPTETELWRMTYSSKPFASF